MILAMSLSGSGHHPAAWRHAAAPSPRGQYQIARRAKQAGFAAVLFRPNPWSRRLRDTGLVDRMDLDTLPLMASAVAPTHSIGLGASLPMQDAKPFNVARIFATLDRLSRGRAAWLALPQPLLPDGDTLGRAVEFAEVVRKLWDSWEEGALLVEQASGRFADPDQVHRINHDARWFTVRGPLNVPRPIQGHPPILAVDPVDEAARAAVASFADLVLLRCGTLAEAQAASMSLRRHAAECGRTCPPLILASVTPVLAEDADTARRRAAMLDASLPPALLAAFVADGDARELDGSMPLAQAATQVITCQTGLAFAGTPRGLAALMRDWVQAGACDGFDLCPAVLQDDVDGALACGIGSAQGSTLRERLGLGTPSSRYAAEVPA